MLELDIRVLLHSWALKHNLLFNSMMLQLPEDWRLSTPVVGVVLIVGRDLLVIKVHPTLVTATVSVNVGIDHRCGLFQVRLTCNAVCLQLLNAA